MTTTSPPARQTELLHRRRSGGRGGHGFRRLAPLPLAYAHVLPRSVVHIHALRHAPTSFQRRRAAGAARPARPSFVRGTGIWSGSALELEQRREQWVDGDERRFWYRHLRRCSESESQGQVPRYGNARTNGRRASSGGGLPPGAAPPVNGPYGLVGGVSEAVPSISSLQCRLRIRTRRRGS